MNLRRIAAALVVAAAVALVAGCSSNGAGSQPTGPGSEAILAAYDLAGLDGRAVIDRLDALPISARPAELRASVRPGELLLTDLRTGAEATMELPDEWFYVSIAPYRDHTHECFYHSLTTCRGELGGQDVHVTITRDDGQVLVDETRQTYGNGFAGFWLPRDIVASLRIVHSGGVASARIETGPDDPTCLTTLRLT